MKQFHDKCDIFVLGISRDLGHRIWRPQEFLRKTEEESRKPKQDKCGYVMIFMLLYKGLYPALFT